MRVLVLAQYYDPVPVPKPGELARWLAARGHDVSVLTGLPNYPSGVLMPGYQLTPWRTETRDGLLVRRVFELPYHGRSALGRIVNYCSFMAAGSVAALFIRRPTVVYAWHPPLTVGVIAAVLASVRKAPFVYDVQDVWPDSALMSGMLREGAITSVLRKVERFVYRRAAHLLVVTEGAKENLIAKGAAPERITVVPHWVDESAFATPDADARAWAARFLEKDRRFVVTFAGNIGLLQRLDAILLAAKRITDSRIAFRFVGDGADRPRLERVVKDLGLGNVRFLGARPSSDMVAVFAESDALVVPFGAGPLSELVIPTKTLAYLAAGRPIVMAMSGPATQMVEEAGAGIAVPSDDPDRLAAAIEELARRPDEDRRAMGERGRAYALAHFRRDDVLRTIEEILESVSARLS
jgi:putative colanic acid biosynthesis glycosyltransferase WcaI